ncbi:FdhF/YdeP family oxidoreductase [Algoriphagus machipongonensis]|uniref:Oxidoreductase alpha (Molybdopterin) subunit n=1 Tax=Algoriphagus machipongonensis TaxID=388413 RepID=A3I2N8_9BACT|nr:FdhF/YdeP family oxidoreductase [Algoriphagus machipongonensis]EAZ79342.1 oxidoreductase alpha (molybdopterin) subunit [Algoriphagus machipongonensis]
MKTGKPATSAAGPKAIYHAMEKAFQSMKVSKTFRILGALNQKGGVDCPGCAWPDPKHRSRLGEYCENGVKAIAEEAMDKNADADFFKNNSIQKMRQQTDYWLGHQGRLTQPMRIKKGDSHYSPVSWELVFEEVSSQLNKLNSKNDAIFYTSGRTSNEAAFLYQLFVRIFGTNNMPDCSNMCHESSGVALSHTLGIGKGSVKLEDFYLSDLILIFGQNPGTNHPRMLSALKKAKENGAKIVVINPLKEAGLLSFEDPQSISGILGIGAPLADLYLQVRINEDVALVQAVAKKLMDRAKKDPAILDHDFIQSKTDGFETYQQSLEELDEESLILRTGLEPEQIEEFVNLVSSRSKIIACWAMGLTQHVNAVDNIQEIVNLLLLKGSIGKPGAGTCPVRGHSNVQGDRTMGIWEKPSKQFLDSLASTFGFEPPRNHGVDVVDSIQLMHSEPGKVFMSMGGNLLSAAPDTSFTQVALENCAMTIHVSTKLNRSHLHHGEVGFILPCLGRTDIIQEKSGVQKLTVENSMGLVHSTQGNQTPRSGFLLSEPHIISQIASKTVGNEIVNWNQLIDDYDQIRELIAKSVAGFEDFNKKIKDHNVLELPNGPREGHFPNDIGKARFTINSLSENQLEENELLMMTIRSHDQFNTTIYGMDDRYRGIYGIRTVVLMNQSDIKNLKLEVEKPITLFNEYQGKLRKVEGLTIIPYNIPEKCIATYFPECNELVPIGIKARKSNTPASKSIKIKVHQP